MAVSGSGLSTRASAFSKALQLELGILLDHTDDGYQRDWRKLVHKLGLTKDYDNIHKQTRRTEAILRIWSCEKPQDSNGRELVKALIDMGRTDAATAVEYHLGEEYDPTANATEDLFSVLDRAAKLGNVEALTEQLGSSKGEELEEKFTKKPYSLLHSAATYGHLPAVQVLVQRGFFVNRRNHEDKTPREIAQQLGHQEVARYLEEIEQKGEVAGESVMATSPEKYQVVRGELDALTCKGDLNGMEQLLKKGHNPDDAGGQSWTPLHTAVEKSNLDAVKLLVKFDADLAKVNTKSLTPEQWARYHKCDDIADYLRVVKKNRDAYTEAKKTSSSLVVTLHRQTDIDIEEYLVVQSTIEQVCQGISEQLDISVTMMFDKETGERITSVSQLQPGQDVEVVTKEEEAEKLQKDLQGLKVSHDSSATCTTTVQLFSKLWSSSPATLPFLRSEDFDIILGRVSKLFHTEVDALYSPSTLTKIHEAKELCHHRRVIAATNNDDIQKAASKLALQRLTEPVSVTVTENGGHLFERKTGVFISVPEYAVKTADAVTITLTVFEPNIRMDFGSDDLRLISHPILVETNPPGYSFSKPVQVRLPHCGVPKTKRKEVAGHVKLLTAPATIDEKAPIQFEYVTHGDFITEDRYLKFDVNHFSWFCALIFNLVTWGQCIASVHYPSSVALSQLSQFQIRLLCYPNLHICAMGAQLHIGEGYARRKQIYSLGYGNKTEVGVHSMNTSWTITPTSAEIPFESLWRTMMPLSCMTAVPLERTFTVTWQSQLPPTQPLNLTFIVAGETTVELQVLVNPSAPSIQTYRPGGFTLPAAAENNMASLLDSTKPDFRDYRGLAGELGFTLGQVGELESTRSPTRALLAKCKHYGIGIDELIEAAEHLERRDVVNLLMNMNTTVKF